MCENRCEVGYFEQLMDIRCSRDDTKPKEIMKPKKRERVVYTHLGAARQAGWWIFEGRPVYCPECNDCLTSKYKQKTKEDNHERKYCNVRQSL